MYAIRSYYVNIELSISNKLVLCDALKEFLAGDLPLSYNFV